jgi:ketosteroid isomerase-like protein
MTIKDYLAVPSERRVVCLTSLDSTTTVGPYKNEYVWFLRFDESGEKITEIVEFLDSKAAADILSRSKVPA